MPPGGGGLYYFHTHYLVQAGEAAGLGINRNEEILSRRQMEMLEEITARHHVGPGQL